MERPAIISWLTGFVLCCTIALVPGPVAAATIIVTNNADNGAGTLRQAIADAAAGDTIVFAPGLAGQTINLAGTLSISKNLAIDGTAAPGLRVSGNDSVRVLFVGGGVTFNLNNLTVANGRYVTPSSGMLTAPGGGGIYNFGTVNIQNCTFAGNTAVGTNPSYGIMGGAINSIGTLNVLNCTFSGNSAYSTTGNTSMGGGIANLSGNAAVTGSTFSGNSANVGGGIYHSGSTMSLSGSIVANSIGGDCFGTITTNSNNLIKDGSCTPAYSGDPKLAALGTYGGPTSTMPPLPGSPAIRTATANCPANDQRGRPRIGGSGPCDIGAVETQGFTLTKTGGDNQSTTTGTSFGNPLEVTLTETGGSPLPGAAITYTPPASGASAAITGSPAVTNSAGIASVTAIANATIGSYNVPAGATGLTSQLFSLTNSLPSYTLNVTVAGWDGDKVESTSPDQKINCLKGGTTGCSANYPPGTNVVLAATPADHSIFSNWSGAYTGSDTPHTITMNGNKDLTANFAAEPAPVVLIIDKVLTEYYTLGEAVAAATKGPATILARSVSFEETIVLASAVEILLKGGYTDAEFDSQDGYSTINGSLKVRNGKLRTDRVKVKVP